MGMNETRTGGHDIIRGQIILSTIQGIETHSTYDENMMALENGASRSIQGAYSEEMVSRDVGRRTSSHWNFRPACEAAQLYRREISGQPC